MALKLKGELTEESYKQSDYVESIESRAVVLQVNRASLYQNVLSCRIRRYNRPVRIALWHTIYVVVS
jgi:hypothetical protein